jgi:hypothetical protein
MTDQPDRCAEHRDVSSDDAFREQVCDWLRANHVNPARIPLYPQASISNGQLTLLRKVQRNGADVLDPSGTEILTETITVPVLVEPTGDVATWLQPRCPECGR